MSYSQREEVRRVRDDERFQTHRGSKGRKPKMDKPRGGSKGRM